jgi:glycosyltransferase involved in cell wall biosynthesis
MGALKLTAISHLASDEAPTGAERSLALLVGELRKRGPDVSVIAPGRWRLTPRLESAGIEVAEIPSRACWLVQWGRQPPWKQFLRYLRWRAPDPGFRQMMVWLDRAWPDVVYVNCLPQLKGAAAARALGLPVVWHVREILPAGHRRRWFARRLKRDARRVVAVSEAVASWIRDEGLGDRVIVVHNGVERPRDEPDGVAARSALGLPNDEVLVGFLGGVAVHKGIGQFVDAAERAMSDVRGLHAVIPVYGPGVEIEALRRRVERSRWAARFHLIAPADDVFRLLGALDMIAFSSIWPDSLPRTVMEAMAAGKPVVAYETGGVPEMVVEGETGFMVAPGDVEGLADRMVRLGGDAELRRRLGAAAAERARSEFSLGGHVDRMERILVEAAGRS